MTNSDTTNTTQSACDVIWRDALPFNSHFGDFYYSKQDGQAECQHVFINGNDLIARWGSDEHFTIGELGFGTGLNFLETWRTWCQHRSGDQTLTFVSVEGHPMARDVAASALSRWKDLSPLADQLLSHWSDIGHGIITLDTQTRLQVIHAQALEAVAQISTPVDAWFLDGFSPAKNPDMWSKPLMRVLADVSAPTGTFASYTAAGWVRKNLQEAGFDVERRPGFGRKRDMIAGRLQANRSSP